MSTKKFAIISAALCAVMLTISQGANAIALSIGDGHELGFVDAGIPSGDADRTLYVNHLIHMALGASDSGDGQDYSRSNNDFGALPDAVFAMNGTSTTIDFGSGSSYSYLFAKYDGPNYGSEVWYIGNLTGMNTIPAFGGQYGLSGWTLFGPGGTSVPEPGTLVLFGVGLMGIGLLRRRRTA